MRPPACALSMLRAPGHCGGPYSSRPAASVAAHSIPGPHLLLGQVLAQERQQLVCEIATAQHGSVQALQGCLGLGVRATWRSLACLNAAPWRRAGCTMRQLACTMQDRHHCMLQPGRRHHSWHTPCSTCIAAIRSLWFVQGAAGAGKAQRHVLTDRLIGRVATVLGLWSGYAVPTTKQCTCSPDTEGACS